MISSIDNHINELNLYIRTAQGIKAQSNTKVAASPSQNKHLLSIERQQKVKESLYLFLLQKREENELSQAFTAYNNRVVTPPSGSNTPTSPVALRVYAFSILLGLLIPIAYLILREITNTSVRGRKDLENLKIPFCCVAANIRTAEEVVLKSGAVCKAIRASMAIPGIFKPVERGDFLLVDGGMLNNLPVDICRKMGARRLQGWHQSA